MAGFERMAVVTASTKRPPALDGDGLRGDPVVNVASVKILPLDPLQPDIEARLGVGLDRPHELLQTFARLGPDILQGDILVVSGVDYPIMMAEEWFWGPESADFVLLVVKDSKVS